MKVFQEYLADPENVNNVIAGLALVLSFISTIFALRAVSLQREHNRKSVEPLPDFIFGNYENTIEVRLRNHGLGPMKLIKVEVLENNVVIHKNLIDVMPPHPASIPWEDFVRNLEDRILAPGEEKPLIILHGEPKNRTFAKFRDKVRKRLIPLTVRVYYKGVYDKKELTHEKALENWFS